MHLTQGSDSDITSITAESNFNEVMRSRHHTISKTFVNIPVLDNNDVAILQLQMNIHRITHKTNHC